MLAGEAFYVQSAVFKGSVWSALESKDFRRLLALDVVVSLLVLILPPLMFRITAVGQFLMTAIILSYGRLFHAPLTFSAIYNGWSLLDGERMNLFSYVYPELVLCPLILCGIRVALHGMLYQRIRFRAAVLPAALLGAFLLMHSISAREGLGFFEMPLQKSLNNITYDGIRLRGYLWGWASEVFSGSVAEGVVETGCLAARIEKLPVFPVPQKRIVLMQVESLDYDVLDASFHGTPVAPALQELARTGFVLRMEGVKRLGSANSDYELLNARQATQDILYYLHINKFPDSILQEYVQRGYTTSVFHGLYGSYMNLRNSYANMGVRNLFFAEEIADEGGLPRHDLFMRQIPDGDLFHFVAKKRENGPRVDMVITITMHDDSVKMSKSFHGPASYFDTVRYFDDGLRHFISTLSDDDLVILYGDHESYNGKSKTHQVPFIVYCKGKDFSQYAGSHEDDVYTRCELSLYLRRLLRLPSPSFANCKKQY